MDLRSPWTTIGERAREAAASGQVSFALPEAAPAARRMAAALPDGDLRDQACSWLEEGASYHALIRLCARAVLAFDARCASVEPIYGPKAAAELEPMLALWPYALVFPSCTPLSERDMVELRALPVHPLGLVTSMAWVDGALSSPSEFFFHDLDHARFKIREDLRELGEEIPDAYQDGTTFDAESGRHRTILPLAEGRLGDELWRRSDPRRGLAREMYLRLDRWTDRIAARAGELLLFEIVHEKGFPLERAALARELAGVAHLEKLRRKHSTGFFGATDPGPAVIDALPAARAWLLEVNA